MRKSFKIALLVVIGPIVTLDLFAVTNQVSVNYIHAWFPQQPVPVIHPAKNYLSHGNICLNGFNNIENCTKA